MEGRLDGKTDLGVIDRKEGPGGGGGGGGRRGCVRLFVGASKYGQPSDDGNF